MRIHLLCHASTDAVRAARFAADEPLDEIGARQATAARPERPRHDRSFCAPSVRCRSTAEALGLTPVVDARLAGWDRGTWTGRSLDDIAASDPEGLGEWLADPAAAPHGGESLNDLLTRVGVWLDGPPSGGDGPVPRAVVAVVDAVVVRAAVAHALGAGPRAIWRIDVDPLSTTLLVGEPGRWSLRALQPGRGILSADDSG